MFKLIQRLQQKPENERRRILIVSTFSITLVIFLVWLASFTHELMFKSNNSKTVEINPITLLQNNLGNASTGLNHFMEASSSNIQNLPASSSSSSTLNATTSTE
ncbi:MAG TPA: hypothetical protein VFA52_00845 [Candidatus Paceibacterota bacterium]|nr:hypothetical protein [Candidatus Paceibacterota bacterium]